MSQRSQIWDGTFTDPLFMVIPHHSCDDLHNLWGEELENAQGRSGGGVADADDVEAIMKLGKKMLMDPFIH